MIVLLSNGASKPECVYERRLYLIALFASMPLNEIARTAAARAFGARLRSLDLAKNFAPGDSASPKTRKKR